MNDIFSIYRVWAEIKIYSWFILILIDSDWFRIRINRWKLAIYTAFFRHLIGCTFHCKEPKNKLCVHSGEAEFVADVASVSGYCSIYVLEKNIKKIIYINITQKSCNICNKNALCTHQRVELLRNWIYQVFPVLSAAPQRTPRVSFDSSWCRNITSPQNRSQGLLGALQRGQSIIQSITAKIRSSVPRFHRMESTRRIHHYLQDILRFFLPTRFLSDCAAYLHSPSNHLATSCSLLYIRVVSFFVWLVVRGNSYEICVG